MKTKKLTDQERGAIAMEVKMMLHAHRDFLRNVYKPGEKGSYNPSEVRFSISDGYYGEAFGVLRALHVLGFGFYGASNDKVDHERGLNLKAWMSQLENEVLEEENFNGSNACDHCLARYGRDGAGRRR